MTNTGFGKTGFDRQPRKHDHAALRRFVLQDLPGESYSIKMLIMNRIEQAAKYWFIQGGGDGDEFESLFNNEK